MYTGWDCHGLPIELKVEEKVKWVKKLMQPLSVTLP
jgi:isoleucyl-tRNA synthetase